MNSTQIFKIYLFFPSYNLFKHYNHICEPPKLSNLYRKAILTFHNVDGFYPF